MTVVAMTVPGVLTPAECEALARRLFEELRRMTAAEVNLYCIAVAEARFARGRASAAIQTSELNLRLEVESGGRGAGLRTNQIDEAGVRAMVARAEAATRESPAPGGVSLLAQPRFLKGPPIFFDATVAAMTEESQAALVRQATQAAEAAGLVAAGEIRTRVFSRAVYNTAGTVGYEVDTFGSFSLTARTAPDRRGSGWAWSGFEDWSRVDPDAVIRYAIDIAKRSANPVAVEPGRYTVILEPAAVAQLVEPIGGGMTGGWSGMNADAGRGVFAKHPVGTNKIGLQMLDRRISITSDPWDPDRPSTMIGENWQPIPSAVTWFDHGVLRNLEFPESYARAMGRRTTIGPGGVRLTVDGPAQTLEEMIATVKRGIWVNRLSNVALMDDRTVLLTGTTRDGTFLIENGKITKPIRNLRFTESPFFVLNRLDAWGTPVRASEAAVVPRLKMRDFNFSSATDAI